MQRFMSRTDFCDKITIHKCVGEKFKHKKYIKNNQYYNFLL